MGPYGDGGREHADRVARRRQTAPGADQGLGTGCQAAAPPGASAGALHRCLRGRCVGHLRGLWPALPGPPPAPLADPVRLACAGPKAGPMDREKNTSKGGASSGWRGGGCMAQPVEHTSCLSSVPKSSRRGWGSGITGPVACTINGKRVRPWPCPQRCALTAGCVGARWGCRTSAALIVA